jgi:site-specific recombinase XerD
MTLEHSPFTLSQLHLASALDHSPEGNDIKSLLNLYLLSCRIEGKSPDTLSVYRQRLQRFINFTASKELPPEVRPYTTNHIRLFILFLMERGLEPSTINAFYRALRTFFNWLVMEKYIPDDNNPMDHIKPPRFPRKKVKTLRREDIDNLLLLCSGHKFIDARNRAIILILLDTGLRLKELAAIQLKDIDIERGIITVMGKGARERSVRMGKAARKALFRYLLLRNDQLPCLWLSEERRPISKNGIKEAVANLCDRAEIKEARHGPHTFRHTAAINCLRNGMPQRVLQMMLGHETPYMTDHYLSDLNADDVFRSHEQASPVDRMGLK